MSKSKSLQPTLAGPPDSPLKLSLITSSAGNLSIADLLKELWVVRTYAIDFYPRGRDIRDVLRRVAGSDKKAEQLQDRSLTERFCDKAFVKELASYVKEQREAAASTVQKEFGQKVSPDDFAIPAIATYFPDIASYDGEARRAAAKALKGAVNLAKDLGAGIVEFVLGRRVCRCDKAPKDYEGSKHLKCEYVYESEVNPKLEQVLAVLLDEVVDSAEGHVRLAAEIEPGYSYLLNSDRHVNTYLGMVREKDADKTLGLNLDIGHMMILANNPTTDITLESLQNWKESIYHAHVSDNVGFHFRDLVPGFMHPLLHTKDGHSFEDWVRACCELANDKDSFPYFSGYVAVEIEGCQRNQWVQRSLHRLGYLIRSIIAQTP